MPYLRKIMPLHLTKFEWASEPVAGLGLEITRLRSAEIGRLGF
jgi:hypothetical protein